MKKDIQNLKLNLAILLVMAILIFSITFLLSSCGDGGSLQAGVNSSYIQIEDLVGKNINKAKNLLSKNNISFEIIEDNGAKRGFISKVEFSGKQEGSVLNIEEGTSVKLYTNTKGLNGKVAYITIDDGPTLNNTAEILDTLDKYGAKATFFVQGKNIANLSSKALCKSAIERGHLVGCHSYSHDLDYLYSSPQNMLLEIEAYENALKEEIGEELFASLPKVFRFPGGSISNGRLNKNSAEPYISAVENAGYSIYDWTCLTNDAQLKAWDKSKQTEYEYNQYAIKTMKETFEKSLEQAENSEEPLILLLHDKWTATDKGIKVDGLQFFEWIVKTLTDKGYILDTVEYLPTYLN